MENLNNVMRYGRIAGIGLIGMIVLISILPNTFADSVVYPLNNSVLNQNTAYNLTVNINSINSLTTNDTYTLFVDGNPIYQNTVSSNGLYHVPIKFYNSGNFTIRFNSTTNTGQTLQYQVNPVFNSSVYINLLNYYWIIIAIIVIGSLISLFLRDTGLSYFIMFFVFLASLVYSVSVPYSNYFIAQISFIMFLMLTIFTLLIAIIQLINN